MLYGEDIWFTSRLPNIFGLTRTVKLKAVEQASWKLVGKIAQVVGFLQCLGHYRDTGQAVGSLNCRKIFSLGQKGQGEGTPST